MKALAAIGLAAAALALAAAPSAASVPQVDYTLSGPPGDGGWFRGPVSVQWTYTGATWADPSCLPQRLERDTTGTQLSCRASNADGETTATTKIIRIDQTAPTAVAALPARPPDNAPWYTAPLALAWSGTDPTSGIVACTQLTYAGPDGAAVAPTGACRDGAGNVSAQVAFPMAFDATAPALADLAATVAAGKATVRWTAGADAQKVTVTRSPGDLGVPAVTLLDRAPATTRELTDGPLAGGMTYTYTATVRDAAGNASTATTSATVPAAPPATAAATTEAKRTAARRKLTWRKRSGARYYNFQLFRNGRKILSAWPTRPHYTLKRTWRYHGRRRTLTPGVYRWYVWPGYGARAEHRYGRMLAKGKLTVDAPR